MSNENEICVIDYLNYGDLMITFSAAKTRTIRFVIVYISYTFFF